MSRKLAGGAAAGTVLNHVALLSAVFDTAIEPEFVQFNPVALAERPKWQRNHDLKVLTLTEFERVLLAAAPSIARSS
jgi:hypothetical protein